MSATTAADPGRLWVAGDWNGFFGLFTNVLLNVIVLTGLCLGVVQLPADTVFGRIPPALGIDLPLGNLFYAYLAWQLAKVEGRDDVTAMPYGPSVPHMFIVVFLIMLPTYLATKNPTLAWQAGLAGCFIIGVIVLIGAFVGPAIRAMTPRAAMLGMENRLGVRLLNRTTRRLALTPEGEAFFHRASRILADIEEAENEVAPSAPTRAGGCA